MAENNKNALELDPIKEFIIFSSQKGYGNAERSERNEEDGSHTIEVVNGEFLYSDNYFGGEPYGGRTIISRNGKPVWIMVYYGGIVDDLITTNDLYPYLRKQLLAPEKEVPVRGPFSNQDGKFRYNLRIEGDLSDFSGLEEIYFDDKLVFKTTIAGGLVDRK